MSNWATSILAPVLGVLLANIMWLAPLKDVRNARLSQQLGTLNPIPFTMIFINCIGWTMYSVLTKDFYLFFANSFGIIIGLFCSSSAMMLLLNGNDSKPSENEKSLIIHMEMLMIGGVSFWLLMLLIVGMILQGDSPSSLIIGIISDVIAIGYYAAPLSSLYQVVMTADASSLHVPTIIANLLNAAMWFIYGLSAINSILVWLPNVLGLILAMIQLTLVFIYNPRCIYCESKQSTLPTKHDIINDNSPESKCLTSAASTSFSSTDGLKHNEEFTSHTATNHTTNHTANTAAVAVSSVEDTNHRHPPTVRNIMAGWRTSSLIRVNK